MVINFRLGGIVKTDEETEAMGRSWYGYDPNRSTLELWSQNRGFYGLATSKIEAERYATLSYRGEIVVVAVITGWEPIADPDTGAQQKALIGDLLSAGDPVHDALMKVRVPGMRNPIGYFPDEDWGVVGSTGSEEAGTDAVDGIHPSQGQGWQSDPVRRKQVEDAAQNRLMEHYVDEGWTVEDTRFGHSYDAVARRGDEVVYLEAKGTETDGASVLISPGELNHARNNPGRCVIGVLSGIRFDDDGHLDRKFGTFSMVAFDPADDALRATGYRWSLPESD